MGGRGGTRECLQMDQTDFWKTYYEKLAADAPPWLDYSNERVQVQSLALAVEAAGPLIGRRCLDVGCGLGQLAQAYKVFGAGEVVGIDLCGPTIDKNRAKHQDITWICGDIEAAATLGRFDLVSLIEMLQYVPIRKTLETAWRMLNPGGRLVAIVPNSDCPIVQRAMTHFDRNYAPPSATELAGFLFGLEDVSHARIRALHFRVDQTLMPYVVSDWVERPEWPAPPNRLQIVACKQA